jgi:hypothetical protein
MVICLICNIEFNKILDHIENHHKPEPEKNNKGDFYCPLCKVKVGSRQKHYCSKLHRWNVENNAIEPQYSVDDYIVHYEKYLVDVIENNKDHPFWVTIKEDLSENDYKLVKEYINGKRKGKNNRRYSRHSGLGRFSRTSKSNQANRKKTNRRKSYSRI